MKRINLRIFLKVAKKTFVSIFDVFFIEDEFGEEYIESVERPQQGVNLAGSLVHFFHKKIKYIWREELNQFIKLKYDSIYEHFSDHFIIACCFC